MADSALAPPDVGKPFLVEAGGSTHVDSLKLLDGGTVRVPVDGLLPTDCITLNWPILGSPYLPLEPQYGVDDEYIDFHIPPSYIALWLDDYANFSCTVTRDDVEYSSPLGSVRISLPSNLPKVKVTEAKGDTLDISLLCCKGPTLHIEPWAFIGTNQTINTHMSGIKDKDGLKVKLRPFNHEPMTEDDVRDGWRRTLDLHQLTQLRHGTELYIYCEVRFRQHSGAVYRMFQTTSLTLLTQPFLLPSAPELQEATYVEPGGWQVNPLNTVHGGHIVVSYDHMCPDDWVCPTFSGTPGPGSPSLECRKVGDGGMPLVFAVPPSAFSANFGQKTSLHYSVLRCDGTLWESLPREVKVLDSLPLPLPGAEEATGDVLNLNSFPGKDATGTVAVWQYMNEDEYCWLRIIGKLEGGKAHEYQVLDARRLEPEWLKKGLSTVLDRKELEVFADCSDIELHVWASFNGKPDFKLAKHFPVRKLHLIQDNLELKKPRVLEAVDGTLEAWNGKDGVTLRVEYERMTPRQKIQVYWKKPDGTFLSVLPEFGSSDTHYVDFLIPREAVICSLKKDPTIYYRVSSRCKDAKSDDYTLTITAPVRLPTPVVENATPPATQGGILDLRTFPNDACATVEAPWFSMKGQRAWFWAEGMLEDGNSHRIDLFSAKPVTQEEVSAGFRETLKRTELERLKHGSKLVLWCKVTPCVSRPDSDAIVFHALELTFRKRFRDVTDFNPAGKGWNDWERGKGAMSLQDLVLTQGPVPGSPSGYYLNDKGFTNTTNPVTQRVKLYKEFTALEDKRTYRFSAMIRDAYAPGNGRKPGMVLAVNGVDITPITEPGTAWQLLQGTFTADDAPMTLSVDNLHMGMDPINDFDVTQITVEDN